MACAAAFSNGLDPVFTSNLILTDADRKRMRSPHPDLIRVSPTAGTVFQYYSSSTGIENKSLSGVHSGNPECHTTGCPAAASEAP